MPTELDDALRAVARAMLEDCEPVPVTEIMGGPDAGRRWGRGATALVGAAAVTIATVVMCESASASTLNEMSAGVVSCLMAAFAMRMTRAR
mgnify:CR=1 FL=1